LWNYTYDCDKITAKQGNNLHFLQIAPSDKPVAYYELIQIDFSQQQLPL
jgi:hypothetical protein